MPNIQEALKFIKSYERLDSYGQVGRMLAPEVEEFRRDKNEDENLLQWCVRKAKEALEK